MHAWGTMFPELRKFSFTLAADMIASDPVVKKLDAISWNHSAGFRASHLGLAFLPNTTGRRVVLGKAAGASTWTGYRIKTKSPTSPPARWQSWHHRAPCRSGMSDGYSKN